MIARRRAPDGRARAGRSSNDAGRRASSDAPRATAEGYALSQSAELDASPHTVWQVLRDPRRVARCLPGVRVDSLDENNRVIGCFAIMVGPIRATFVGDGVVSYEEDARRGAITGKGSDRFTRSSAVGRIGFAVLEGTHGGTSLEVDLRYALTGPLAQFGRSTVITEVVARLVRTIADNLSAEARGEPIPRTSHFGVRDLGAPVLRKLFLWLVQLRR